MLYRDRGYLPHLEIPDSTYFITFRLAGTLPQTVLEGIRAERAKRAELARTKDRILSRLEEERLKYLESHRIQEYLDKGIGECCLRDERIAGMVQQAIGHFEGIRYDSHAWCIMPNHVHWLITTRQTREISKLDSALILIVQGIKSFTAHQANKILKRTGSFWLQTL